MKYLTKITTFILIMFCAVQFSHAETNAFIRRSKLKKKRTIAYRVVVIVGKKAGELAKASSTISTSDKEAPKPTLNNFDMTVTTLKNGNFELSAELDCDNKLCLFEKDADPIGKSYTLKITFKDKNGKQIGSTESIEVTAELDKSVCESKFKIMEVELENLDLFYPKTMNNSTNEMLIVRRKDDKDVDLDANISWSITYAEGKGLCTSPPFYTVIVEYSVPDEDAIHTYETIANYNEKTKTYSAKWPKVQSAYTYSFWIKPRGKSNGYKPILNKPQSITNTSIAFATKKVNEEDDSSNDSKDSTINDYSLEGSMAITDQTVGKLQVFTLKDVEIKNNNSKATELPAINALVHLSGCDSEKVNISVKLKYDSTTKKFSGSEGLLLCNSKTYDIESITIIAKDKGLRTWTWTHVAFQHSAR